MLTIHTGIKERVNDNLLISQTRLERFGWHFGGVLCALNVVATTGGLLLECFHLVPLVQAKNMQLNS